MRQEIGNAARQHLRLARAGARHDEQRAVEMFYSLALHGIQTLKNIHCINLANPRSVSSRRQAASEKAAADILQQPLVLLFTALTAF